MTSAPRSITDMERHPPYPERLNSKPYEVELRPLQIELLKLQRWVREQGRRVVVLFEGRDAAGKGGPIKRFTENLNPRGGRVVALTKPNEAIRTVLHGIDYDHKDDAVAHRPDEQVVQPASALELPADDPLAGATSGRTT